MNSSPKDIFNRTELLLGEQFMDAIAHKKVIIFGVGGVGSWCAEGLIRSGLNHLTIVDSDCVAITNINRQMMATTKTIGQPKVDALKEKLLDINPNANIQAINAIYSEETAESFNLEQYDYIIDCIDSLKHKSNLILHACRTNAKFFSSMGAALKLDPTKIHISEFWKVQGCPLARALRNKFKNSKTYPKHKFLCVYSDELLTNKGKALADANGQWDNSKAQINGSLVHITAIFGLHLSSLVMMDINKNIS